MKLVNGILDILFPPKCVLCQRLLERDQLDLCRDCRVNGPEYPLPHTKRQFLKCWTALWYYEDTVRESILRYKFYGARHYCVSYGRLLAMKIRRDMPDGVDVLTWVPVSRRRKRHRGYDQVELLAREVGKELELEPVGLLIKIRHNKPQSGIDNEAKRRANVLGAYRVTNQDAFLGKRVLILDDVITTGATVGECARMLLTAGAKEVYCAALAAAHHQK